MSTSMTSADQLLGYQHEPAYDSGFLPVGSIHKLHYEQYGKPDGKPVIFLHGGPGGSTSIQSTLFFNPAVYRVVLFDQRGAGKSLPLADLRENTTEHLLSDIEVLRAHLGIEKWHTVFGGSWGSTLSLLYAQAHPDKVGSLVLRGIFTATHREFNFSRGGGGTAMLLPEYYDEFIAYLPPEDREEPFKGYYKLATSDDRETIMGACRAYNKWGLTISTTNVTPETFNKLDDDDWVYSHGRLELHYHTHNAWLEDDQIMRNLDRIKHIPCTIVQGRHDFICAARTAWNLHKGLPGSELYMIPFAGHGANEPGTRNKLVEACDKYGGLNL